jgi:hypothetical protein
MLLPCLLHRLFVFVFFSGLLPVFALALFPVPAKQQTMTSLVTYRYRPISRLLLHHRLFLFCVFFLPPLFSELLLSRLLHNKEARITSDSSFEPLTVYLKCRHWIAEMSHMHVCCALCARIIYTAVTRISLEYYNTTLPLYHAVVIMRFQAILF